MRRKLASLISLLIALSLITTPVFADQVDFNGPVVFSLGSLIASGQLKGLGHEDVTVTLDAKGTPAVTCTNHTGQKMDGRNPQTVSASGSQTLNHNNYVHGTSPFRVETGNPQSQSATALGCPDNHWTAKITFVYWSEAVITVRDAHSAQTLLHQAFNCTTTRSSVNCHPAGH